MKKMQKMKLVRKPNWHWNVIAVVFLLGPIILNCQRSTPLGNSSAADLTVTQYIQSGAMIVDVRTAEEFSLGSYRNAKNIPLQELKNRLGELGDKQQPIVLFCRSGSRSAQALNILRNAGFIRVINAGGLRDMP